jgi:hypothetical protein|tara:strand:- start:4717 stop:4980 length:264 start_codon:yes stop_codon:yes gene_type:complete
MIKVILFKNNLVLISRLEEVGSEMGEPDCKLIDPFELKGEFLESWPSFSMQREMMVHSDSFLTILEPDKKQLDKYQSLTAKNVTEKA